MTEQKPDAKTLKAFNAGIVDQFRANGGKTGGRHQGADLLLMTTTGAKSGQLRLVPRHSRLGSKRWKDLIAMAFDGRRSAQQRPCRVCERIRSALNQTAVDTVA